MSGLGNGLHLSDRVEWSKDQDISSGITNVLIIDSQYVAASNATGVAWSSDESIWYLVLPCTAMISGFRKIFKLTKTSNCTAPKHCITILFISHPIVSSLLPFSIPSFRPLNLALFLPSRNGREEYCC
jgi:hypothetical protein